MRNRTQPVLGKCSLAPQCFESFIGFLADTLSVVPEDRDRFTAISPDQIYEFADYIQLPRGEMARAIAGFLGLHHIDEIPQQHVDPNAIPALFSRTNRVLAAFDTRHSFGPSIVLANPFEVRLIERLQAFLGKDCDFTILVADPDLIDRTLLSVQESGHGRAIGRPKHVRTLWGGARRSDASYA